MTLSEATQPLGWGNYERGRKVHPVQKVTKWRRPNLGDRVVVAMIDSGRRLFVFADDPSVGVRMPIGTVLHFDEPLHVKGGWSDCGMKAPSGYEESRDAVYSLKKDRIFGRHVVRPTIAPMKKWAFFLNYVYTAQCMVVKVLPNRKKPH